MRIFRKCLVSLASAALVLGSLAATGATVSAATVASAPFSDVTSSTQYANAIDFLAGLGIINGTGNGLFQPTTPVTRAEMAKIVVLDAGKGSVANSLASMTPSFTDASSIPTWAWGYVNAAVAMGIVDGYPNGTFEANNNVTDAEALAMFTRALGNNWNVTGTWPQNYVLAGFNYGIANGISSVSANVPALRGEIAQMAYNAAINAEYTVVNSNGTNMLTTGGGLFTKNESSGGAGNVYPENIVGTIQNVGLNSITMLPTAPGLGYSSTATTQTAVTYGLESSVTLIGATSLSTALDGSSATAVVDSNGLVSLIDVSVPTTTAADTLNSSGNETTNFSLPAGFSLPTNSGGVPGSASAPTTTQAEANTSCDETPGVYNATATPPFPSATTGCNHNNIHNHVLVVQDSAGNNYLLMSDGKTIEYGPTTTITVNGANEGLLMGNEQIVLAPGASITANMSSGIATSVAETITYTANLVTSVNPANGTITFNEGGSAPITSYFVNASSATITLNGQPSTLSAIQPNDAINVVVSPTAASTATPNVPGIPATSSIFGNTLGASSAASPATASMVADTRNTVTGTITSSSTSTTPLSVSAFPYTSVTITLQPSSGNAVTLTTDGDQLTSDNATLGQVNANVTLALDSAGGILAVLSTSASAIPVAMITGSGSSSSVVNGATEQYVTLTGIAGSSTTTYNEVQNASATSPFLCNVGGATNSTAPCMNVTTNAAGYQWQPTTTTNGFNNFWALTTNASGQVAEATYLGQIAPATGDTFEVVSAGSSAVTIEALNSSGSVDTTYNSNGFGSGYLTVTNGTAFSGVTASKYIGFAGLLANDVVNLYYGVAPTSSGGSQNVYAIVDTYR